MNSERYIGFVETTGLGRALQAAEAMVAGGKVALLGHERCGERVIVFVGGDRADVDDAVGVGCKRVSDNAHVARSGVVPLELACEFQEPLARFLAPQEKEKEEEPGGDAK